MSLLVFEFFLKRVIVSMGGWIIPTLLRFPLASLNSILPILILQNFQINYHFLILNYSIFTPIK